MTGNQVVSTMFDFDTCNHMVRFVLWVTRLKTLDIIFAIQVAMEYVCFATHRSTVYVSWLCRLDWKFVAQIHSVFQWLCYLMTAWIHSVWLVAMTFVYDVISLWSEYGNAYLRMDIYMILCWYLDVCRSPIRCAFGFWHTHTAYKVFRLSLIPLSDFGGHSVIHIFGYQDDDMIMSWWWKI